MSECAKSLGILISAGPNDANFRRGLQIAGAALAQKIEVYLYCLDEAVAGCADAELQALIHRGLRVFACALAAQRRRLPFSEPLNVIYGGLGALHDLQARTDRFVAFN